MSASVALLRRIFETPKTGTKNNAPAWVQNSEPRFLRYFTGSAITGSFTQKCTAAFVELRSIDFRISSGTGLSAVWFKYSPAHTAAAIPRRYFEGSSKGTPNYRMQRTRSTRR